MYVTIITNGSRGDVQPFVALALGLQQAGHHVRLAADPDHRGLITGRGIEFAPLAGSTPEMLQPEDMRVQESIMTLAMHQAYEAARDADVIVAGTSSFFLAEAVAEVTGLPLVYGTLGPMAPTWSGPSSLYPELPAPLRWLGAAGYHQLTHAMALARHTRLMRESVNHARARVFGLPARGHTIPGRRFSHGPLFLNGYSREVAPRPRDWAPTQQVTGYWFLERSSAWEPSARLLEFLDAGPPPVYVGFGSMNDRDPSGLADLAVDALRRAGQRGILVTGWGGLASEQRWDDIFVLDEAPHDWLFPRVSAVVHHGGAGTTAAGLRAGCPTVVVPYQADQPFWGSRVRSLGAGPRPIARRRLTVEALAEAIFHAVTAPEIRAAARRVGTLLHAEDGVGRAVTLLERHLDVARVVRIPPRPGRRGGQQLSAGHGG